MAVKAAHLIRTAERRRRKSESERERQLERERERERERKSNDKLYPSKACPQ
jgi:hypothetical protein